MLHMTSMGQFKGLKYSLPRGYIHRAGPLVLASGRVGPGLSAKVLSSSKGRSGFLSAEWLNPKPSFFKRQDMEVGVVDLLRLGLRSWPLTSSVYYH